MEQTISQTTKIESNVAKSAFFYMLSMVALVFMALSTGMIIFQIINKNIADAISNYSGVFSQEALKFAISAIIISTPIYYLVMRQINKDLFSGKIDKNSGVRKWLTYFILFVSSVVVIGWLIGIINSFLGGELTIKFVFKAITAVLISAVIFTYYLYDIKRENVVNIKDKTITIYSYATLAIVIIVLIASFFFIDSPAKTRNINYDDLIIQKFSTIDNAINNYYNDNKKLPANLDELKSDINYLIDSDLENPLTKKKFDYKAIDNNKYELCADFKTSNRNDNDINQYPYGKRWIHDEGYQCIRQNVVDISKPVITD